MSKDKKTTISVQGSAITILSQQEEDYISLTDMAKKFGDDSLIYSWMRNRNSLEFLGIWEQIHNPDFKGGEFETFKKEAGLNSFHLTPRKWVEATAAVEGLTGSTIGNLGLATIRQIRAPIPPTKAEQEAIAEALSDADALIESLEQLLTKKRHLKQAAMQELLTDKKSLPGFSGEWEVRRLGDLFTFSGGHTASRDQLSTEGHCYLHYGDIHKSAKTFIDARVEFQDIPKLNVPLRKVSTGSLLEDGDVVFVDASEDDEGTSKHVVVLNERNIPFISGLHTIVAKSKSDNLARDYRRYCFQTPAIREQFLFYAVGTKVSGISKTNIAKINLPVPPVPEQKAIAAILIDMDAEVAELESELAKTRAIKQGMMQKLLTHFDDRQKMLSVNNQSVKAKQTDLKSVGWKRLYRFDSGSGTIKINWLRKKSVVSSPRLFFVREHCGEQLKLAFLGLV